MNIHRWNAALAAMTAGAIVSLVLWAKAEMPGPDEPQVRNETTAAVRTPERAIRDWPEISRGEARVLIEKYGEPNSFDDDKLVWETNSPWEKTIVYRKAPDGMLHRKDILEQSIAYDVPTDKLSELKRFDGRIMFDQAVGELSSRAENESLNFLALNLVDEIVGGKRTPGAAGSFYRRTVALSQAGKSSAYTAGFLFPLSHGESAPARDLSH